MILVVCPGQGSQTPGFLEPWLTEDVFRNQLVGISDAIGIDLVAHGTVSDADTIRDTAIAQPLIVAAGLLALSVLLSDGRRERIGGVAGHSVGEVTRPPRRASCPVRTRWASSASAVPRWRMPPP